MVQVLIGDKYCARRVVLTVSVVAGRWALLSVAVPTGGLWEHSNRVAAVCSVGVHGDPGRRLGCPCGIVICLGLLSLEVQCSPRSGGVRSTAYL